MFEAEEKEYEVAVDDNTFSVKKWAEIETDEGWKVANSIEEGDILRIDKECLTVISKQVQGSEVIFALEEVV